MDVERLRDRGHEQLGIRHGGEADEDRTVAELGLEQVGEREGETCLSRSARPGERDEPRPLVAIERADRRQLQPAADQRRGGYRQRSGRAARGLGSCKARVLLEDCALELLQRRAGVEAEVLREEVTGGAVDLEGLRLAAAAVEGEQPLLQELLAIRMLGAELLELGHDGVVPPAGELRVDAKLERGEP